LPPGVASRVASPTTLDVQPPPGDAPPPLPPGVASATTLVVQPPPGDAPVAIQTPVRSQPQSVTSYTQAEIAKASDLSAYLSSKLGWDFSVQDALDFMRNNPQR
jgi:hypothetical protein